MSNKNIYWEKNFHIYKEIFKKEVDEIKSKKIPGVDKFEILTDYERMVASEVFGRHADMHTGKVTNQDLKIMFTMLGQNPTDPERKCMLEELDEKTKINDIPEEERVYNFNDFLFLARNYAKTKSEMYEELMEAFEEFDTEKTGYIYTEDIRKILEILVNGELDEEMVKLLSSFEDEKDGKIHYKKFILKAVKQNIFSNQRF